MRETSQIRQPCDTTRVVVFFSFFCYSYVATIDENPEPGTVINFGEQYSTRVKDEDIGKAGVFALKLENNNNTFEISPTVAERSADFIVTVRDNAFIDYERYKVLSFKVIVSLYTATKRFLMEISLNFVADRGSGGWSSHELVGIGAGHCVRERRQRQSADIRRGVVRSNIIRKRDRRLARDSGETTDCYVT